MQTTYAQQPVPFVINNNNNNSASSSAAAAAAPSTPGMYMPVVRKSAGLAAVLSFFIPGLGQIYCGRLGRGIMFFLGSVLLAPIFIGVGIWIWGIIDAYSLAERYPMP